MIQRPAGSFSQVLTTLTDRKVEFLVQLAAIV